MQCPHCFREKDTDGACPYCGYDPALMAGKYPQALKPGSVLNGRYILGHVLGQGGFGITYLAWDDSMKERVAIKEYFPAELAGRSGVSVQVHSGDQAESFAYGKAQFLEEAKTLASFIGCPGIVRIDSYFEENGTAYMSMEYVDGLPLNKYMAEHGGRLTSAEANRLLLPLMESLEAVHAKGVVHRDIAPDNILVTKDGTAKLIDFGAARYSTGEKSKSLDVILKHGFAPFEQYLRRGRQGPWTDVYALAATYYYTVTGKVPQESAERVQEEKLIPPRALGAKISAAQEKVLLHAMAVNAQNRYQHMDAFRRAMQAASEEESAPKPTPAFVPPKTISLPETGTWIGPHSEKEPIKRITLPLVLGAVAVLVMVIFGVTRLTGREKAAVNETAVPINIVSETPKPTQKPLQTPAPITDPRDQQYAEAEAYLQDGLPHKAFAAFRELGNYRDAQKRAEQIAHDMRVKNSVPIAAGWYHTAGLKKDGRVLAVGKNQDGQCNVSKWTDIVAVGAGSAHTVALKADGTVLAVGNNQYGQNSVSDWTDVVAVAAGAEHTAVLKADGTVIAVGRNDWGQCNVSEWTDIIAISAGRHHTVGVKEDGTVIAAGAYRNGTCDFSKMTDIVAVAAGQFHTIGLRGDGKVIGVRYTGIHWAHYGEDNVSDWSDIVSVAAGSSHSVGLHADGTVVAVGDKSQGELNVKTWNSVVAVAAGYSHTVGLKADGSVCAVGYNEFGQCDVSDWQNIAPAK